MLLTLTQQIKRLNTFKASAGSNMQQNSYIAWEGNSLIDGSPIILILAFWVKIMAEVLSEPQFQILTHQYTGEKTGRII
jgi:hypothetical protein